MYTSFWTRSEEKRHAAITERNGQARQIDVGIEGRGWNEGSHESDCEKRELNYVLILWPFRKARVASWYTEYLWRNLHFKLETSCGGSRARARRRCSSRAKSVPAVARRDLREKSWRSWRPRACYGDLLKIEETRKHANCSFAESYYLCSRI